MRYLTKAEQAALPGLVSRAVEAETADLIREIAAARADLARITAPLTPVMTHGTPRRNRADEAAALRSRADDLRRDDPTAARGLLDKANELLRKG